MGTNYYRIPTVTEMEERRARLAQRVAEMELTPANIECNFNTIPTHDSDYSWEYDSPWSEFTDGIKIHLGKRSMGWRFCWNFHKNHYYTNKAELIKFVKSGRVVNEYGEELTADEFLEMAFNWCPDGIIVDKAYFDKHEGHRSWMSNPQEYYDLEIDGLRVSTATEFS